MNKLREIHYGRRVERSQRVRNVKVRFTTEDTEGTEFGRRSEEKTQLGETD